MVRSSAALVAGVTSAHHARTAAHNPRPSQQNNHEHRPLSPNAGSTQQYGTMRTASNESDISNTREGEYGENARPALPNARSSHSQSRASLNPIDIPPHSESYHISLRKVSSGPPSPTPSYTRNVQKRRRGSGSSSLSPSHRGSSLYRSSRSGSASSTSSIDSLLPFPTYSAFRLPHLLFDLPFALLILLGFTLLVLFGWPASSFSKERGGWGTSHHLHWYQVGLGALSWTASEAIRKRLFKFVGNRRGGSSNGESANWVVRAVTSEGGLLLAHTVQQEFLRLFCISLSFRSRYDDAVHHQLVAESISRIALAIPFPGSNAGNGQRPAARPPKGFFRSYDLALGFAAAETLWKTLELLGSLSMYRDVLPREDMGKEWLVGEENLYSTVHESDGEEPPTSFSAMQDADIDTPKDSGISTAARHPLAQDVTQSVFEDDFVQDGASYRDVPQNNDREDAYRDDYMPDDNDDAQLEEEEEDDYASLGRQESDGGPLEIPVTENEFNALLLEKKRVDFEAAFGCALWEVPVVIVAVWRLDATLLNLALTLFLSLPFHSYYHTDPPTHRHPTLPLDLPLWPTFLFVVLLHWTLSFMWTLGVRARRWGLGMPAISYGTLVLVLMCFFASLGAWGALT